MYGVNGEALQLLAVYKKPYFLLQVTRESVSGTASLARCVWMCNEIEDSYDKIIITIVPSYTGKNISLVCCRWHCYSYILRTCNNTDSNKPMIFSGIASYYGDNYIGSLDISKCFNCTPNGMQCIVLYIELIWQEHFCGLANLSK